MRKVSIIFMLYLFTLILISCGTPDMQKVQQPVNSEVIEANDNASKIDGGESSIQKGNKNESDLESDNKISDVKADYYATEQFVSSYVESRVNAANNNDFNLIKDDLDEESNTYISEKQFVEDNYSNGIKLNIIYSMVDETKQVTENQYNVYYIIKLEETTVDKTKEEKIINQIFTVFDNGNTRKILNIQSTKSYSNSHREK